MTIIKLENPLLRKFFLPIAAGLFALTSLVCAPLTTAVAFGPTDPGLSAVEHIKHDITTAGVGAVLAVPEDTRAERLRPTVVVYNTRTCMTRVADASGRLHLSTAHRAFAVPWIKCRE